MQIIIRVTVLAVCVLSTLAFPNVHQDLSHNPGLNSFQVQLQASLIDTHLMSPPEANCADAYNARTQNINDNLITQINFCFANANSSMVNNNVATNYSVADIRRYITIVQLELSNCSSLEDNTAFLNCIIQSFDNSMKTLDFSNSQAHEVLAQMSADMTQVQIIRQGCTNAAIGHGKVELVENGNMYNMCLNEILQLPMRQKG